MHKKKLFSYLIVLYLSGCGGGGGSDSPPPGSPDNQSQPPQDTDPPVVINAIPNESEQDVELDIEIVIEFDGGLDSDSVSNSDIVLSHNDVLVSGTVSLNTEGDVITFRPDTNLEHMVQYKVEVGPDIEDVSNNAMQNAHTWHFTTRDQRWGEPKEVSTNGGSPSSPHITILNNDDFLISWSEQENLITDDWSAYYSIDSGLQPPQLIAESTTWKWSPRVANVDDGNIYAISLLKEESTGQHHIVSKKFNPDGTWRSYEPISQNVGLHQLIDTTGDGFGIVAWTKDDGTNRSLYATSLYSTGTAGPDVLLEHLDSGYTDKPRLAVDAFGNAVAVWAQWDGYRNRIYANRYDVNTGSWEASPTAIDSGDSRSLYDGPVNPKISIDQTGNAVVVWEEVVGSNNRISAAQYLRTSGWQSPQVLDTDTQDTPEVPVVQMIAENRAIAVWKRPNDVRGYELAYSIFDSSAWSAPEVLSNDGYSNWDPVIASNGGGNAWIMWHHVEEPHDSQAPSNDKVQLYAANFSQAAGFSSPKPVSLGLENYNNYMSSGQFNNPGIALDLNSFGDPIVVWRSYSPQTSIYFNTLE